LAKRKGFCKKRVGNSFSMGGKGGFKLSVREIPHKGAKVRMGMSRQAWLSLAGGKKFSEKKMGVSGVVLEEWGGREGAKRLAKEKRPEWWGGGTPVTMRGLESGANHLCGPHRKDVPKGGACWPSSAEGNWGGRVRGVVERGK